MKIVLNLITMNNLNTNFYRKSILEKSEVFRNNTNILYAVEITTTSIG